MKTESKDLIIDDLARKLLLFGFSQNQAKVYLSIVEAGSISIGNIAKATNVYRQDIYKILPILEKKGLVTRSLGSPMIVKAIPVRTALPKLVEMTEIAALQNIRCMKANLDEICNAVSMLCGTNTDPELEEDEFCLLTTEQEITNKADHIFANAKSSCDLVLSVELLRLRDSRFAERFKTAAKNGVIIRLIVETPVEDARITWMVESLRPKGGSFFAKTMVTERALPFMVIDDKKVWISTTKKQELSGLVCILWSTGKNIVGTYQERFKRLWNDKTAVIISSSPIAKPKEFGKELETPD